MELYEYYKSLDKKEREAYAERAGTTLLYLNNHIMKPRPKGIKGASLDYMQRLARASDGKVDLSEVVDHFVARNRYSGSRWAA